MQVPWRVVSFLVSRASAHGWLVSPPAVNEGAADHDIDHVQNWPSYTTSWFEDYTTCPGTTGKCGPKNVNGHCPGTCPGQAPILGSCGVHEGCHPTKDPYNQKYGNKGNKECDARHSIGSTNPVKWKAGGNHWVAWTVTANHEGTVAYRLCPSHKVGSDYDNNGATEKCFQAHHLEFSFERTRVQCYNGKGSFAYPAEHVKGAGGKMYRKSILLHCSKVGEKGKPVDEWCKNPDQDHLPCNNDPPLAAVSLKDNVMIPANLAPGKYVLSWRWDCGNTAQIWMNCADVEIVAGDAMVNTTDLVLL